MVNTVKWAFAVGHVFNDLCSSVWFLFTMPYFTKVLALENYFAGDIILIGQIADAIATQLIGIESDKVGIICHKYIGRRKSWHLLGTILCALSFPFIYNSFFQESSNYEWFLVIYYSPFVIMFQIAWAIVQITHLSLIPVLMNLGQDNSSLNSLRYMFTVASNVIVLTTTTLLFNVNSGTNPLMSNSTTQATVDHSTTALGPKDKTTFTYLTIGVVGLGLFFSFLFHLGVPENTEENKSESIVSSINDVTTSLLSSNKENMTIKDWFKEPQFYLINLLYLATRLIVNVSQVYLILYVIDSLGMTKMLSSLAALTTFISGSVTSFLLKMVQNRIGKKLCYLTGLIFIMGFCVMVSFSYMLMELWKMYLSMVLLGVGCSIIMIGSLSLTAELIGKNCSSSSFVYGSMSCSDKLFSGLVIWIMQRLGPSSAECSKCRNFYQDIEIYFVGGTATFAFVMLLIIYPMKIGSRWKNRDINVEDNSTDSVNS